jgi:hypothetical protein
MPDKGDKGDNSNAKKPYEPPKLTVYGTVRELTQMQGLKFRDARGGGFQKTNG